MSELLRQRLRLPAPRTRLIAVDLRDGSHRSWDMYAGSEVVLRLPEDEGAEGRIERLTGRRALRRQLELSEERVGLLRQEIAGADAALRDLEGRNGRQSQIIESVLRAESLQEAKARCLFGGHVL